MLSNKQILDLVWLLDTAAEALEEHELELDFHHGSLGHARRNLQAASEELCIFVEDTKDASL